MKEVEYLSSRLQHSSGHANVFFGFTAVSSAADSFSFDGNSFCIFLVVLLLLLPVPLPLVLLLVVVAAEFAHPLNRLETMQI